MKLKQKIFNLKNDKKKQSTYLTRKTRDLGHETMITSQKKKL
jgi:hypothetical protein